MTDSINRLKFLKLTGSAGLGFGLLSNYSLENYQSDGKKIKNLGDLNKNSQTNADATESYHTNYHWTSEELWSKSISDGLNFTNSKIILDDHILIEDDAPGIGSIQNHAWEALGKGVVLLKQLNIDRWPVKEAILTMLVYPVQPREPMSGGKLEFYINGNDPIIYEIKHFWTSVPVPATYLKQGQNSIKVRVHGDKTQFRTPIALHSHFQHGSLTRSSPSQPRSRRSLDGGYSWTESLGVEEKKGEYPIRLKLRGYREKGWLQTQVIDLSETENVLHFPVSVESARIRLNATFEGESNLNIFLRNGKTHRPEAGEWSDWKPLNGEELPSHMRSRFIQLKFEATSEAGDITPRIEGLHVSSRIKPLQTNTREQIFLYGVVNRPLIDSPYEFKHEDPTFPELQEFRHKFKLDEVVKGTRTEMEKIMRLRNWVAGRWNWFMPSAESEDIIQWNSRQILSPDNVEPGGYCLFFSIVFAQACQSFGIPARMVNINYAIFGGHEVAEFWSREYDKWVMVDANFDSIFVSRDSGEPLSVLELHKIFLDTYYPNGEVVNRDEWTYDDRDRRSHAVDPESIPIRIQTDGHALSGEIDNEYVWWKVTDAPAPGYAGGYGFFNTAYIRWLPRSNWLSQPLPMPVTHGRTHWGWDGYLSWAGPQTPETPEHRHFVRRESDMYGRLFTVDFSAEVEGKDTLIVHMATNSPAFDHYELIDNGNYVKTHDESYRWLLVPGINILKMKTVDVLDNRGPNSELKINYMPV